MKTSTYFDAHTHVQFSVYDADREAVIRRAQEAGVQMINAGTERTTSASAVALAERYDGVYASIALYPTHTSKSFHDVSELGGGKVAEEFAAHGEVFDPEYYRELALHPKIVAIGECGLDYFRLNEDESREAQIEKQKAAFIAQIALAHEVKKPLVIHCRAAFTDLIGILRTESARLNDPPGIIHFFIGTSAEAAQLLELGFSFTFGGVITFARSYDETIKIIPPARLLSETDAPYVAPVPHRGKRNEPAYVVEVVKKLAELKNISAEEMKEQIWRNAEHLFRL